MSRTRILGPDGRPAASCVRISIGFAPQPLDNVPQDIVTGIAPPREAHDLGEDRQ